MNAKTAACLAAGLVSSWDAPARADQTFTGEITPATDLTAVYFLFAAGPCAAPYSKKIADFIPGNTTTSFDITFSSLGPDSYVGDNYAIIALYDSANGGVSLGFDPTEAASILGQSPAPDFNGPWSAGYGNGDEASVAGILQSGTYNGGSIDDAANMGGLVDPNTGLSMYYW